MKVCLYIRVSTTKQELEHQETACRRLCEYKEFEIAKVYSEKISSSKERPEYLQCIKDLRSGLYDGVVVFRLDRLGRTAREMSFTVEELERRGIRVLSVNENFDTTTIMGKAMREIMFILNQMERDNIGEATKQRLQSLKADGVRLGQKPLSAFQVKKVRELAAQGLSCRKIAKNMQLSKTVAYNIVHRKGYYSDTIENAKK
jgi:DNA invertase Pin-like site-specific DNA recombinase